MCMTSTGGRLVGAAHLSAFHEVHLPPSWASFPPQADYCSRALSVVILAAVPRTQGWLSRTPSPAILTHNPSQAKLSPTSALCRNHGPQSSASKTVSDEPLLQQSWAVILGTRLFITNQRCRNPKPPSFARTDVPHVPLLPQSWASEPHAKLFPRSPGIYIGQLRPQHQRQDSSGGSATRFLLCTGDHLVQ